MVSVTITPATPDHIPALAPRLRAADADEVWATSRHHPAEALARSLAMSTHAWTGCVDGEPAAMWGVAPINLLAGIGSPWLLGSDLVERHQRAFLRRNREYVGRMRAVYPVLRNHVDARNVTSIRWLRWLGFTVGEPEPFGALGLPFRPFEMRG